MIGYYLLYMGLSVDPILFEVNLVHWLLPSLRGLVTGPYSD